MKKVIVFAGSNSKNSINKELAIYASSFLKNAEVQILDLNDFSMPVYGVDEESVNGIPQKATNFYKEIEGTDGIILSLAEHNGNFTAAFKNVYDWMSRIEQKLWQNKPMLLMATSPGGRGGVSVLNIAKNGFPHFGGAIVSEFSLPKFQENFKDKKITDEKLLNSLKEAVATLQKTI